MTALVAVLVATTVYKTVGTTNLTLRIDSPASGRPHPAILLIHGGGWRAGNPELLSPHARHFASNGFVAVTVRYRLTTKIADCVEDCRDALRYVRQSAGKLEIDPQRIVVAGESAGGQLATMLASDQPAALVLYNPVVDLAALPWVPQRDDSLSPIRQIRAGWPPTLLIHGVDDKVVLVEQSDRFVAAMRQAGNRVEYHRMAGWEHAFLIPQYGKPEQIATALRLTDAFLEQHR